LRPLLSISRLEPVPGPVDDVDRATSPFRQANCEISVPIAIEIAGSNSVTKHVTRASVANLLTRINPTNRRCEEKQT
jgi:hypothetical protein